MTQPFLQELRRGGVLLLTMNRPDERNALSTPKQCDEIVAAARRINTDDTLKAVVLTGSGTAFCSGGNVKHMRSHEGCMAGNPVEIAERYRRYLPQIAIALYELELPLIAAVNGPAMGAGLDIACMCDIRLASDRARFAETFVRLGLISGIGGGWFLPRVVGAAMAAELSFTGRVIDAEAARRCGLVSEVVPEAALLDRAWALAEEIAQHSGVAIRFCKRLLRMSAGTDLRSSLEAAAALQRSRTSRRSTSGPSLPCWRNGGSGRTLNTKKQGRNVNDDITRGSGNRSFRPGAHHRLVEPRDDARVL